MIEIQKFQIKNKKDKLENIELNKILFLRKSITNKRNIIIKKIYSGKYAIWDIDPPYNKGLCQKLLMILKVAITYI